jgi:hypothetical protein
MPVAEACELSLFGYRNGLVASAIVSPFAGHMEWRALETRGPIPITDHRDG